MEVQVWLWIGMLSIVERGMEVDNQCYVGVCAKMWLGWLVVLEFHGIPHRCSMNCFAWLWVLLHGMEQSSSPQMLRVTQSIAPVCIPIMDWRDGRCMRRADVTEVQLLNNGGVERS